ncbi:hypothetical protein GN316_15845 [Xylophilus sp. Kf1]|nr:hypothetical protein [Xylophilus sp. Kf1]
MPLDYFPTPDRIRSLYPDLECANVYGIQDSEDFKQNGWPDYHSGIFIEYVKRARCPDFAGPDNAAAHAQQVVHHISKYLSPPDRDGLLTNRQNLADYSDRVGRFFSDAPSGRYPPAPLSIVLLVASGCGVGWKRRDAFMGFRVFLVAVHLSSHILTDGHESDRFVFDIEFVCYILFAAVCGGWRKAVAAAETVSTSDPAHRAVGSGGIG